MERSNPNSLRNRTLSKVLENRGEAIEAIYKNQIKVPEGKQFVSTDEIPVESDKNIHVCVRCRPLFDYESEAGSFNVVTCAQPSVYVHEPKIGLRGGIRVTDASFDIDYAFGPEDDNDAVYGNIALPLVRLALDGGVGTMFAYGQTGSGKTYTMTGIETRLARDIFEFQNDPKYLDENGSSHLEVYLSFFELLGDNCSDLLNKGAPIEIREDKFGQIQTNGCQEILIEGPEHFEEVIIMAAASRRTKATFKNDTSSRSHAICKIRVANRSLPEAEDGRLYLIDLAGSERGSDSQYHDKDRFKETQLINKSLMSLKECIRNRVKASVEIDKFIHIPYRNSKLTLLLKDAFELESRRQCRTVVMACISPNITDASHSLNTLRYAAPIKVAVLSKKQLEADPRNPATWSNADMREWVVKNSHSWIDPDTLCPFESGLQLCRLPEQEFMRRCLTNSKMTEKKAKAFYVKLWGLVIDARTRDRKKKLQKKDKRSEAQRAIDYAQEMQDRIQAEQSGGSAETLAAEKLQAQYRSLQSNRKA